MRWLRMTGYFACGLMVLLAGLVALVWFDGGPVLAWALEHPVSAYLGRRITTGGPLSIAWGAQTRIIAHEIQMANASWGSAPDMFAARSVEIDIRPWDLLRGDITLPRIRLDEAKLLLETSADGKGNWSFGLSAAAPQRRGQVPNLEHLIIERSNLVWHNGRTGAKTDIRIGALDYRADSPAAPLVVHGSGEIAGTFQRLPMSFSGTFGPLGELRNRTKPYPVRLSGRIGEINFATDGTIEKPLNFSGVHLRLSLSGNHLADLAAFLGVPMPALPEFRGTSELSGGNGHWTLAALTIALGASDLEGGLSIDVTGKVPAVHADLTSRQIDLADFKGIVGMSPPGHSAAPQSQLAASDRIFSATPINVKELPDFDADLSFYGTRIVSAGGLPFDRLSLGVKLQGGEITVAPLRFHGADGDFDLTLHFTPFTKASAPRLQASVDIHHVDLHQLLRTNASATVRETAGILGGFVKIDTEGVSMRELMAHMNGDAGIFMGNGQFSQLLQNLIPIDVLTSLGVYATGDKPLPIDCLVARFGIKDGVATVTTLLFDAADTIVTGSGNLNFAAETIDGRLVPYNKKPRLLSLRTPIDLGGTFAHPSFHLETAGLVAKLATAAGLGVLFPPAALVPLIDTGLGSGNACSRAFAGRPLTAGAPQDDGAERKEGAH